MWNVKTNWMLPPIVGEISNLDAVIICEPKEKTSSLKYVIQNNVDEKSLEFYSHQEIIQVNELGPNRIILSFPRTGCYEIKWFIDNDEVYQHGIVISNEPNKIIFVSCDLLEADLPFIDSMWTHMQKDLNPTQKICLFHVGDQAYMDKVFKDNVKYAYKNGHNDDTANFIIKAFGKRYCDTWIKHHIILAGVSNYNLWDDHEIKNNIMLNDITITNDEAYVRDLAVNAYSLYQESQHLYKKEILSQYSWTKRMGLQNEILILAIERTSRLISVEEILEAINTLATDIYTNRIILCFSSAPVPRPHGSYGSLYNKFVGDKGTIETSKFWPLNDLTKLYHGLFSWMETDDEKEVLIVGGDLHFGIHGIVQRNNKEIPVIISSPITNQPTIDRWLASKGMAGIHHISDDNGVPIIFTTLSSKARRCYACVDLDTVPMKITMNYSSHKFPHNSIKYFKTLLSFK